MGLRVRIDYNSESMRTSQGTVKLQAVSYRTFETWKQTP